MPFIPDYEKEHSMRLDGAAEAACLIDAEEAAFQNSEGGCTGASSVSN